MHRWGQRILPRIQLFLPRHRRKQTFEVVRVWASSRRNSSATRSFVRVRSGSHGQRFVRSRRGFRPGSMSSCSFGATSSPSRCRTCSPSGRPPCRPFCAGVLAFCPAPSSPPPRHPARLLGRPPRHGLPSVLPPVRAPSLGRRDRAWSELCAGLPRLPGMRRLARSRDEIPAPRRHRLLQAMDLPAARSALSVLPELLHVRRRMYRSARICPRHLAVHHSGV